MRLNISEFKEKNMTVLEKLRESIVVPVVVLDRAEDAVPTAKALLAGGVGVMEITLFPLASEGRGQLVKLF